MNSLIPAALAVGLAVGLGIGIIMAADYNRKEPTKREQALSDALEAARQAGRLPAAFRVALDRCVSEQITTGGQPVADEGNEDTGPKPGHPDGGTPA